MSQNDVGNSVGSQQTGNRVLITVAVIGAVGTVLGALIGLLGGKSEGEGQKPVGPSASADVADTGQKGSAGGSARVETAPSELPDSMRCAPDPKSIGSVFWWSCVEVSGSTVRFLVRLENRGASETDVVVRLGYFVAGHYRDCPEVTARQVTVGDALVEVAAGGCSIRRQGPIAVQSQARVVRSHENLDGPSAADLRSVTVQILQDGTVLDPGGKRVAG